MNMFALGIRRQHELFRWVLATQNDGTRESVTPLHRTRELFQSRLKSEGWALYETAPSSVADLVGMDIVLHNKRDGRYFFWDTTLDPAKKMAVSALRAEGVIYIRCAGNPIGIAPATKFEFLNSLLKAMDAPALLNTAEIPLPPYQSGGDILDQRYLRDVVCGGILSLRVALTKAAFARREQARVSTNANEREKLFTLVDLMSQYEEDVGKASTFAQLRLRECADPKFKRRCAAFTAMYETVVYATLLDMIYGHLAWRPEQMLSQHSNKMRVNTSDDELTVSRGPQILRVQGFQQRLCEVVQRVHDSLPLPIEVKREMVREPVLLALRNKVVNKLGTMSVSELCRVEVNRPDQAALRHTSELVPA